MVREDKLSMVGVANIYFTLLSSGFANVVGVCTHFLKILGGRIL